ncbi:MAG: tRNA pseudouridine(13) synthase TruD [Myxococcaceae bacterium]|nr:tRNA pseudouridine(13) synthase TruD [Myxococcaceae bacterium]
MRLKQKPEDFSVKESFRFDQVDDGDYRVYLMDKQKLSTFEALAKIREKFGLKPDAISYCGLKDKQGRTEQLIAVHGHDVAWQDELMRLKLLGYTDAPLSARNITSNRFSVTARAVKEAELPSLTIAAAEVERLGVVNYFDSQRFGSLKHGQGFIAKDLLRGDFEAAMRNMLAVPSELDRSEDAKVKQFWKDNWGDWGAHCPYAGNRKYYRVLKALRDDPTDYLGAFMQFDQAYRAMQLFTFQSYLWNEGVRRLLQLCLPRESLFVMPYQAGSVLFHREASGEVLDFLRQAQFPLLGPDSTFDDPRIQEAALWALGKEKLRLDQLVVPGAQGRLFFKHEPRPVLVNPAKLVLGKPRPDELNKGLLKVNIAFTLPPGSYATLVVKRLFHFTEREEGVPFAAAPEGFSERQERGRYGSDGAPKPERIAPPRDRFRREAERRQGPRRPRFPERDAAAAEAPDAPPPRAGDERPRKDGLRPPRDARYHSRPPAPAQEPRRDEKPLSFREAARQKKAQRAANRAAQAPKRK